MPYLPAKDELVSLNRLSSRGLWKWYNSKVLDRRLYGVGQHFTFCRFSRKRKFFGNFDCDFRKCLTNGFFSDWIWRISKFPFWRQILDIYRQPLLNSLVFMNYEWVKFEIKEKGKPEYTEKNLAEWGRKPTTAGIEPKSHCRKTRLVLLPLNTTTITNCYYYY